MNARKLGALCALLAATPNLSGRESSRDSPDRQFQKQVKRAQECRELQDKLVGDQPLTTGASPPCGYSSGRNVAVLADRDVEIELGIAFVGLRFAQIPGGAGRTMTPEPGSQSCALQGGWLKLHSQAAHVREVEAARSHSGRYLTPSPVGKTSVGMSAAA
jgi:hypothetical protein